ncbi:bile acid:sodium symporter family protein [Pararhodospirillum oryzae]|uniref:Sodium transporter n=1 Tax=Pararhodospirillum oryzae TaxID=478448 RepID=A0A512HCA4_9PROT|nr:bile acid:sodium symporter family protein [Pararhodospirillum oryzae]GEO83030.1 sodium transporter [Pararhodospirillum oryzae]
MIPVLLPLGLGFIMMALGLGLRGGDFIRVLQAPRALVAGLVSQMVLLPALAGGLLVLYDGPPAFGFGLLLLAACPGGITSNLLTALARGNVALSISMTAVTSLLSLVSIPLILGLAQGLTTGASQTVFVPVGQVLASVFVVCALPLAVGMGVAARWPGMARRLHGSARRISTVIFAAIVVGAFWGQRETMLAHALDVGPWALALNLGTMALAMAGAALMRLPRADGVAIALECGLQNAALAIFLATSVFHSPDMVVPAIVYALLMNLSAGGFIAWARRRALPEPAWEGVRP